MNRNMKIASALTAAVGALAPVKASTSQYRVTIKPSVIVPDFDVR